MVPAPASTAGMVNTPVPMMVPMTRPVADVRPSARAFCSFLGDIGDGALVIVLRPLSGAEPTRLNIGGLPW